MAILILCKGNSCRSQMVHGFLKTLLPYKKIYSAGVETHGVNPIAVKVMKEIGINISDHTSNAVEEYVNLPFELVITVCDYAKEVCPYLPGSHDRIHQNFEDPANAKGSEEERIEAYRTIRDEIGLYSESLAKKYK